MAENIERELGWDDEIEHDSEFQLLPAGDYNFEVLDFERGRYAGGDKLPACNKAVIKLKVSDPNTGLQSTINHNLFLHSSCEGMLCAFFNAIGLRKKGEKLKMDWNKVPGTTGRCKLSIRHWTNDKGEEKESNNIKKFYEKAEAVQSTFQAGVF